MLKKWSLVSMLGALMLLFSLVPTAAFAQSGGTKLAGGLANPRGLTVGPDGSVYVVEAGMGGSESQVVGDVTVMRGTSGKVTKIAPGGTISMVGPGLMSNSVDGEATGAADVVWANGYLWVLNGYLTLPGLNHDATEGSVMRIDPATGASTVVANVSAYELQSNPGGFAVDTNPYGMALGSDGMLYVADAGGNSIIQVNPTSGATNLAAVIPGISIPAEMAPPGGNPERGGANELDPVPTGLAQAADGSWYVSLLSGGPFPTGAAKVVRVGAGGAVTDAVGGLTMLTDIKLGPDGNWYVAKFAEFDLTSTPPGFKPGSGEIWRLGKDGSRELVAGGLLFPNKLAFDSNGNLYATVNSVIPMGGEVWRWDGVAAAAISPVAPGMPRTGGEQFPFEAFALFGLVLLLAGFTMRARMSKVSLDA